MVMTFRKQTLTHSYKSLGTKFIGELSSLKDILELLRGLSDAQ